MGRGLCEMDARNVTLYPFTSRTLEKKGMISVSSLGNPNLYTWFNYGPLWSNFIKLCAFIYRYEYIFTAFEGNLKGISLIWSCAHYIKCGFT